ncbi:MULTISPECIES: helix-turn-helix domain-containing protein [unclassified Mycolicibacterium]|uniref:helix-turn-helix domain-containing protein n=1 Tax=unclassified Mycolicibacterium TaxID=2636767 RepID=UPI002EDB8DDC
MTDDEAEQEGAIEEQVSDLNIGYRLRSAREQRGLTINQVAQLTGLTKGFISQVERDKTSASVATLQKICDALTLRLVALFEPPRTFVSRRDQRRTAQFGGSKVSDYVLTPPTDGRMQVLETHIEPGGGGDPNSYRLPIDGEFVVVLDGQLVVEIEGLVIELAEGDALSFSARDSHRWYNPSDTEPTRVMWVLTKSSVF